MTELMGEEPEVVLAERRYAAIAKILETVVKKREEKRSFTDILDHVFLHRVLGIPIFLALLYAVFQFTFSFSAPFSDMIDLFFGWLGSLAELHIANPMLSCCSLYCYFGHVIEPIFRPFGWNWQAAVASHC